MIWGTALSYPAIPPGSSSQPEESAWHCSSAPDVKPLASNGSECRIGMSSSAGRAELNTPLSQPMPLVIHPLGELRSPAVARIQTWTTADAVKR